MHLDLFLKHAVARGHTDAACASVISALAAAAGAIASLITRNGMGLDLGDELGGTNSDGDTQKAIDIQAEEIIRTHLGGSGAGVLLSEEQADPVMIDNGGESGGGGSGDGGGSSGDGGGGGGESGGSNGGDLIVAVDPLDGSSNISVNSTTGTIFSILPGADMPGGHILQPGRAQRAAGFFTYGPQTTLIVGFAGGGGVACFVRHPESGAFLITDEDVRIPHETDEYAINAAYGHHWPAPIHAWMDEVLCGTAGAYGKGYRQRWVGALAADAWRIFRRGGVFLYPADARPGYEEGRLRLVYEANPIAFLAERAGGRATDGVASVLDITPSSLHQRTPFIFGSTEEVMRLEDKHRRNS